MDMQFDNFCFGSLQIDGSTYEHDVIIDRGEIRKRHKKTPKKLREDFGHTPLSVGEDIPWKCDRLVVGIGAYGGLPAMREVRREAERRKVKLLILPMIQAIEALQQDPDDTYAILTLSAASIESVLGERWPVSFKKSPHFWPSLAETPTPEAGYRGQVITSTLL
jgi:hypothetical protein